MGKGVEEWKEVMEEVDSIWDESGRNSAKHRRGMRMLFRPDKEVKLCEGCGEFKVGDWCEDRSKLIENGGPYDCWRQPGTVLIWDERVI